MKVSKVFVIAPKEDHVRISRFQMEGVNEIVRISAHSCAKKAVAQMLKSDLVVTSGDWYNDQSCSNAVAVARIMNMEIIHETRFEQYAKQINDRQG